MSAAKLKFNPRLERYSSPQKVATAVAEAKLRRKELACFNPTSSVAGVGHVASFGELGFSR